MLENWKINFSNAGNPMYRCIRILATVADFSDATKSGCRFISGVTKVTFLTHANKGMVFSIFTRRINLQINSFRCVKSEKCLLRVECPKVTSTMLLPIRKDSENSASAELGKSKELVRWKNAITTKINGPKALVLASREVAAQGKLFHLIKSLKERKK